VTVLGSYIDELNEVIINVFIVKVVDETIEGIE